jgi:hypothetical protein
MAPDVALVTDRYLIEPERRHAGRANNGNHTRPSELPVDQERDRQA